MHYANARPTERCWRRITYGPFLQSILGKTPIPELPVFGMTSLAHLGATLAEFRTVLHEFCDAVPQGGLHLDDVLDSIHERSGIKVNRQLVDRRSRRLFPSWDTENRSLTEMLYSYLILSFYEVRIDALRRCIGCERFFFTSGQKAKYCTGRCQVRAAMKRYRARKKERMVAGPEVSRPA